MEDVRPVTPGWWNAFRPWTLHGAVVPVLIGGAVAYHDGSFCWWIFILIAVGGCLLQSAANLLNTYGDFVKGTDTEENHTRSPELVSGAMEPRHVYLMGMACLAATASLGLIFIWYAGWGILWMGLVGIAGAGLYTVGVSYKYHGMGQISVFILMGLLMPMGTYFVLTCAYSWEVLFLSIPNAFLITAVLAGNETRDYFEDRRSDVGTLSGHLSYEGSRKLYLFMNSAPFAVLAALLVSGIAPPLCALAFATLYDLRRLFINLGKAPGDVGCNRLLVPMAFRLNWHFGVLLVLGYLLEYYALPLVI